MFEKCSPLWRKSVSYWIWVPTTLPMDPSGWCSARTLSGTFAFGLWSLICGQQILPLWWRFCKTVIAFFRKCPFPADHSLHNVLSSPALGTGRKLHPFAFCLSSCLPSQEFERSWMVSESHSDLQGWPWTESYVVSTQLQEWLVKWFLGKYHASPSEICPYGLSNGGQPYRQGWKRVCVI